MELIPETGNRKLQILNRNGFNNGGGVKVWRCQAFIYGSGASIIKLFTAEIGVS
jgi:hypothetical protein